MSADESNIYRGICISGIGGILGILLWLTIARMGVELEAAMIGVGLMCGVGMALKVSRSTPRAGLYACMLALGAIIVAKAIFYVWLLPAIVRSDAQERLASYAAEADLVAIILRDVQHVPEAEAKEKALLMLSSERRALIERYRPQLEEAMVSASVATCRQQGFFQTMFAGKSAAFLVAAGIAAVGAFRMYADP